MFVQRRGQIFDLLGMGSGRRRRSAAEAGLGGGSQGRMQLERREQVIGHARQRCLRGIERVRVQRAEPDLGGDAQGQPAGSHFAVHAVGTIGRQLGQHRRSVVARERQLGARLGTAGAHARDDRLAGRVELGQR